MCECTNISCNINYILTQTIEIIVLSAAVIIVGQTILSKTDKIKEYSKNWKLTNVSREDALLYTAAPARFFVRVLLEPMFFPHRSTSLQQKFLKVLSQK